MTVICQALACLFAFLVVSATQPVEMRVDYTPAARSSR